MIEVQIPASIKVGGFDYNIKIDVKTDEELKGHGWRGSQCEYSRDIEIMSTLRPQEFSSIAIHELLHAVSLVYGVDLCEHDNGVLANGLHQVMEQLGVRFVK
uniref:SprT-like domain-containing protein n=1 Tax=viral metagenome TaxID=1070528 RepID=A0A6M3LRK1_9ZZZZ